MQPIFINRDSPSDEEFAIVCIHVDFGQTVVNGDLLFEVEGAKSLIEVLAPADGYVYFSIVIGQILAVDTPIATISSSLDANFAQEGEELISNFESTAINSPDDVFQHLTEPARCYAAEVGLTFLPQRLRDYEVVTLQQLKDALDIEASSVSRDKVPTAVLLKTLMKEVSLNVNPNRPAKKCVLLGGNDSAIQILDATLGATSLEIVGFFQDSGHSALGEIGLQYLGAIDLRSLIEARQRHHFDSAIITVSSSPRRRLEMLQLCEEVGIEPVTVVHPSVQLGFGAQIGAGSVVLAGSTLGPLSVIGKACFISANSNIEHHCVIGDGVSAGPSFNLSGRVTIGRGTRVGIGVSIEPSLVVGEWSVIASGCVVRTNLDPDSTLKRKAVESIAETS